MKGRRFLLMLLLLFFPFQSCKSFRGLDSKVGNCLVVHLGKRPNFSVKLDPSKLIVRLKGERLLGEDKVVWVKTLLAYRVEATDLKRCDEAIRRCPAEIFEDRECRLHPNHCQELLKRCPQLKRACQHVLFACPKLFALCMQEPKTCLHRLADCERSHLCPWHREEDGSSKEVQRCLDLPFLRFDREFEKCSQEGSSSKSCLIDNEQLKELKLHLFSGSERDVQQMSNLWEEACSVAATAQLFVFVAFQDDLANSFASPPDSLHPNVKCPAQFAPFRLVCR